MHARLDHRLAPALRGETLLHRVDDLSLRQRQRLDVGRVEIVQMDRLHDA